MPRLSLPIPRTILISMQEKYNPQELEPLIQAEWERTDAYKVSEDADREKYYCLSMLPYPSGALHIGHVRNYTIGDVISRFHRMQGKNVLQPMGWDAFGLPAENAAIQNNTAPAKWTYANIENMRGAFKRLGFAYDWSREVTTCQPDYYRWEQQMFTRLFSKGLVYRRNAVVNWDPVDQTVLANEQVVDGRGWRSGAEVERREIPQWFLKITAYADELLDGLDSMDGWPQPVKTMQTNWIGRSEGAEFALNVCDADGTVNAGAESVKVFTTRPDTSFGITYAVLAPEHPLVATITTAEHRAAVENFVKEVTAAADIDRLSTEGGLEKRGLFTGAYVLNPFNEQPVPVYVADYVLMGYGTGAIMAVPGQDERDYEFAKAHGLPVIRTIQPPEDFEGEAYTGDGPAINSEWLNGLNVADAKERAIQWLVSTGIGERATNYRLRDWGVSRQRYWGCPIPIIYCEKCDAVPVPEDQLPVVLPEDVQFMGVRSPIKADPEWRKTTCPECGGPAERETDTFDTFMESSWYYARYCCPDADDQLDERANYWLPVDQYIGGIEHAILHLLYFRFYHKLMRDAGMVNSDEPCTRLLCQGMVIGETFYRDQEDGSREWINPQDVTVETDDKGKPLSAALSSDGSTVTIGGVEKMSKSKNNGVDPQSLIDRFGADSARLFVMFAAPPDQHCEWSDTGAEGAWRFLKRVWAGVYKQVQMGEVASVDAATLDSDQQALRREIHKTIAKVTDDINRRNTFNTAIAAVMELTNHLNRFSDDSEAGVQVAREGWLAVIKLLAPVTPHICQQMWQAMGGEGQLHDAGWPSVDESALVQDEITIVVQVNGKVRARIDIPADAGKEQVEEIALANENVQRFIQDAVVRKVIYVPGKLLNIVAV